MLAMAICLKRYMKHNLSPSIWNSIEKDWLAQLRECLGNSDGTPQQVLRAYVEELDITVAFLNEEMDLDCWIYNNNDLTADDTNKWLEYGPGQGIGPDHTLEIPYNPALLTFLPTIKVITMGPPTVLFTDTGSTTPGVPSCFQTSSTQAAVFALCQDYPPTLTPDVQPPDKPPQSTPHTSLYPPGCLFDECSWTLFPPPITVNLCASQKLASTLVDLPPCNSISNSVTHLFCTPCICGVNCNKHLSRHILKILGRPTKMVDGGSNVCVMGDLGILLDVVSINLIVISVALDGTLSPPMISLPREAIFLSPSWMAPTIIKHVSTAPTWSKQ